jgi:hypothetical protein
MRDTTDPRLSLLKWMELVEHGDLGRSSTFQVETMLTAIQIRKMILKWPVASGRYVRSSSETDILAQVFRAERCDTHRK